MDTITHHRWPALAAAVALALALTSCDREHDLSAPEIAQAQDTSLPPVLVQAAPPVPGAPEAELEPDSSLTCFLAARERLLLLDSRAIELCTGAASTGPVACFEAAESETNLLDTQIIELCRCANSPEPAICFERGESNSFLTNDQLIALCSPITTLRLRRNCAPVTPIIPAPAPAP